MHLTDLSCHAFYRSRIFPGHFHPEKPCPNPKISNIPTGTRRAGLLAVVICFLFLVLVKVTMFPSPSETPLPVRPVGTDAAALAKSRETAPQDELEKADWTCLCFQ